MYLHRRQQQPNTWKERRWYTTRLCLNTMGTILCTATICIALFVSERVFALENCTFWYGRKYPIPVLLQFVLFYIYLAVIINLCWKFLLRYSGQKYPIRIPVQCAHLCIVVILICGTEFINTRVVLKIMSYWPVV